MKTSEAARVLGVSTTRVMCLIRSGSIKAHKDGRRWVIDPKTVDPDRDSRPGTPVKRYDVKISLAKDDGKTRGGKEGLILLEIGKNTFYVNKATGAKMVKQLSSIGICLSTRKGEG